MHGFRISFFTQQGRTHGILSISKWLLKEAKELGIKGATVNVVQGGIGDFFHFPTLPQGYGYGYHKLARGCHLSSCGTHFSWIQ